MHVKVLYTQVHTLSVEVLNAHFIHKHARTSRRHHTPAAVAAADSSFRFTKCHREKTVDVGSDACKSTDYKAACRNA